MNRAALEKPFPEELIKTRKGAFGKELSFIEAVHYIRRLNDAFDEGNGLPSAASSSAT